MTFYELAQITLLLSIGVLQTIGRVAYCRVPKLCIAFGDRGETKCRMLNLTTDNLNNNDVSFACFMRKSYL